MMEVMIIIASSQTVFFSTHVEFLEIANFELQAEISFHGFFMSDGKARQAEVKDSASDDFRIPRLGQ